MADTEPVTHSTQTEPKLDLTYDEGYDAGAEDQRNADLIRLAAGAPSAGRWLRSAPLVTHTERTR